MSCDLERGRLGRGDLDLYVDGEGSAEERATVEAHLRECSTCALEAVGRLQLKQSTKAAATRYVPTPEFQRLLQKSIREDAGREGEGTRRTPWWSFPGGLLWMPALASVLVVLVVVLATWWVRYSERQQEVSELVDLHVATLASANPVDVVSTDRHTVKPWFQGKLPFTFNLPELQNSPFQLLGGRVMYFRHGPGAQLLFEDRSHKLSVFVFEDESSKGVSQVGVTTTREMAFNLETWREGELRFVVVSDTSAADVHALGELLRAAA